MNSLVFHYYQLRPCRHFSSFFITCFLVTYLISSGPRALVSICTTWFVCGDRKERGEDWYGIEEGQFRICKRLFPKSRGARRSWGRGRGSHPTPPVQEGSIIRREFWHPCCVHVMGILGLVPCGAAGLVVKLRR